MVLLLVAHNSWARAPHEAASRCAVSVIPTFESNTVSGLEALAQHISFHREKFLGVLDSIQNRESAQYEIKMSIAALRGVRFHELHYLEHMGRIENIAVYGAPHFPLYHFVVHALIPGLTQAQVWIRVPKGRAPIYSKLMTLLKEADPELRFDNIHLVTENQEIQLTQFYRKFVLGMNSDGTRFLPKHSEIVIFNGAKKNGDQVSELLSNLPQMQESQNPSEIKILFFRDPWGLNPMVVTEWASRQLDVAAESAVESIMLSSSQPELSHKFYVLHKSVVQRFLPLLRQKMRRQEKSQSPWIDSLGSLGSKEFHRLVGFRNRWSKYLLNPNAGLDEDTKKVDPHFFIFPFSKFQEVSLELDHRFFLKIFTYDDQRELAQIASDPRVQNHAMYASVFGESSSTDLYYSKKIFEDNFHSVLLNKSPFFAFESGNFPAGGYGRKTARALVIKSTGPGHPVTANEIHRPVLILKEASTIFGETRGLNKFAQLLSYAGDNSLGLQKLERLIAQAADPATAKNLKGIWADLLSPQHATRPFGISAIQAEIEKGGLHIVVNKEQPQDPAELQKDHEFYGENILYMARKSDSQKQHSSPPVKISGVVLHPSFIGEEVETLNSYRGEMNPHLGWGYLHALLASNKTAEYRMADAIWPGSMPGSREYIEFKSQSNYPKLERLRKQLVAELDHWIRVRAQRTWGKKEKTDLIIKVASHLQYFFSMIHEVFPEGAFVKNFDESLTGDLGNPITTFSQKTQDYASQFVERLEKTAKHSTRPFSSPHFIGEMKATFYETGSLMITDLLLNPRRLLIQQRVRLAKTALGFPMEIRVNFVEGTAISSLPRYSHEYLAETQEAEAVLNQFFSRAPDPIKMISGGADLAKLENGQWMFMEFNVGSSSGSMIVEDTPIEANIFMSRLQGKPTPMIRWLDKAFDGGLKAQRELLESRTIEVEKWHKTSVDDLSLGELAKYFRNRYMEQWGSRPTPENAAVTMKNLRWLFSDLGDPSNRDLPLLLEGAEKFLMIDH